MAALETIGIKTRSIYIFVTKIFENNLTEEAKQLKPTYDMTNKAFIKKQDNNTYAVQVGRHEKVSDIMHKVSAVYDGEQRLFFVSSALIEQMAKELVALNITVQECTKLPDQKPIPKILYVKGSADSEDHSEVIANYSQKVI